MNSYDIVGNAVREYWKKYCLPCDVVCFFYQKYEWENNWEWCEELVECDSDSDFESITFHSDFCEGQTMVKDLKIVPLWEVTELYTKTKLGE